MPFLYRKGGLLAQKSTANFEQESTEQEEPYQVSNAIVGFLRFTDFSRDLKWSVSPRAEVPKTQVKFNYS